MLCFIFSLQAVAAADVDADDTNGTALATADVEDAVEQSNNLSSLTLPANDNALGEGEGSFTDLQNRISGDTVTLTENYKYVDSDSDLKGGITLSGTITIDGGGSVEIDASNQARIFNIASGAVVTLKGITFINANSSGNGGAIYSEGTLIVDNCKFIDNTAAINGGAIYWAQGAHDGVVTNSEFTGNTARRSGGAIYWFGHDGTIEHSTFTNNNALGLVEAPDSYGDTTYGGYGGAIMWVGSNGLVDDCTFDNNKAMYNAATNSGGRGGAVYLQGSVENGITIDCTNTTFKNSVFTNNFAGTNGGAIDWHEGAHDGLILNSRFENNVANANGGAVYWRGHHGEIINSNFTNNTAKGLLAGSYGNIGDGGAML